MLVRLDEMSWPEVKERLSKPNVIIVPVGSTEQHGAHLPLNVDSVHVTYIAERAAEQVVTDNGIAVLVAPTIDYTDISVHKMFPGTVGVSPDTLVRMMTDIVRNFLDQGFNNIITLGGHHENNCSIETALRIVADKYPNARLFALNSFGLGHSVLPELIKAGPKGIGHALEWETSTAQVMQPQNIHLDRAIVGSRQLPLSERYIGASGLDRSKGVLYYTGAKGFEKSGTFGDPSMASREAGETLLSAEINALTDIIMQVAKARVSNR